MGLKPYQQIAVIIIFIVCIKNQPPVYMQPEALIFLIKSITIAILLTERYYLKKRIKQYKQLLKDNTFVINTLKEQIQDISLFLKRENL